MGYHTKTIPKGELGEISKIVEEVDELVDANKQGCKIMVLCELSDILGAIDLFLAKHHPSIELDDLIHMSVLTSSAFKEGSRK